MSSLGSCQKGYQIFENNQKFEANFKLMEEDKDKVLRVFLMLIKQPKTTGEQFLIL